MNRNSSGGPPAILTADVKVPFTYTVISGSDPLRRSSGQKAFTRTLNLVGFVFDTTAMECDGLHISISEGSYARNSLEIQMDLGTGFAVLELLGQVEWYERRSSVMGDTYIVGVSFVDIAADALGVIRDFLQRAQLASR